jgi:23S rRNA (guanosine2251-2'-O)-methyltransferase
MTLELRNPHAILAALRSRAQDIEEIRTSAERGPWAELADEARRAGVTVTGAVGERGRAAKGAGKTKPGRDSAGRALVKERADTPIEEMFAQASENSLYLALDQIQDPQNVGAIFRSAAFFGVAGLVMPSDRAAPLSGVAYDVASGGLESVPFAREGNLRRVLEQAQAAGLWILGTSEHAETSLHDVPRDRSWLVVLGNEERGLRRLTEEQCDVVCSIPRPAGIYSGAVDSLNVAVSAGIVLAALRR